MLIEDLLRPSARLRAFPTTLEVNPLTEDDRLREAQLLDIRFDALRLTVGVLFDLRMSVHFRQTNTGVLIAHGVRELVWSGPNRETDLTAWTVGGSSPGYDAGLFAWELGMWPAPGAQLRLDSGSAAFYAGDVPGLDGAPPNYGDDDEATIRAGHAHWGSELRAIRAVFLASALGGEPA